MMVKTRRCASKPPETGLTIILTLSKAWASEFNVFSVVHFCTYEIIIPPLFSDLYTENNLDQVIYQLDTKHLNNTIRGVSYQHLFRAVVPLRHYSDTAVLDPKMPVQFGLATTDPRGAAGQILRMGGVCDRWFGRHYGLQIFFFT
jgi:hypothetical protein